METIVKDTALNKKSRVRSMVLVICLALLLVCGLFCFLAFKSASGLAGSSDGNTYKSENVIEKYAYYQRDNATEYQKELFKELKALCVEENPDDLAVVECIAKNFIADYYTWTNKQGSYDVGGMSYIYGGMKESFYVESRDNFYKYLTNYINEYGAEKLIEVASLTGMSAYGGEKEINGKVYDSYGVQLDITYKDGSVFNGNGFATRQFMLFIKTDEGRFELVETYGNF